MHWILCNLLISRKGIAHLSWLLCVQFIYILWLLVFLSFLSFSGWLGTDTQLESQRFNSVIKIFRIDSFWCKRSHQDSEQAQAEQGMYWFTSWEAQLCRLEARPAARAYTVFSPFSFSPYQLPFPLCVVFVLVYWRESSFVRPGKISPNSPRFPFFSCTNHSGKTIFTFQFPNWIWEGMWICLPLATCSP